MYGEMNTLHMSLFLVCDQLLTIGRKNFYISVLQTEDSIYLCIRN